MDTYFNYLQALAAVASQAEDGAEACHLVEWARATIPDATDTDYITTFQMLSHALEYWNTFGAWEDELFPCLTILHTIAAIYPEMIDLETIAKQRGANALRFDNHNEPWPCTSYEDFCDKYAHILN